MKIRMLAVAAAMVLSAGAYASTPVFSDNFNADTQSLDAVPTGWSLSANTDDVDIIGVGGQWDLCPATATTSTWTARTTWPVPAR